MTSITMASVVRSPALSSAKQAIWNMCLIITGSFLTAVAINGILIPQHFATGGVTGLALIFHKLYPSFNLPSIYFLLNIPMFVLAWMTVGRRFFFYSVAGMFTLSLALAIVHIPIHLEEKVLSAILAGIISGTGAGITLRSLGSQGGLDILSIMLLKRFSIRIGTTIMIVNGLVLMLVTIVYSLEAVLYTLLVIYVSAKVVNLVVTGLSQRKAVFIISSKWREISKEILKGIHRGVTVIQGEGGYSGREEHILYTVITFRELGQLKAHIQQIDPNAFVVVNDTLEVMNYRIGNQPHW